MAYSREIYRTVKARFAERRAAAFDMAAARRRKLYAEDPRFEVLDREFRDTARRLITASLPTEIGEKRFNSESTHSPAREKDIHMLNELRAQKAELLCELGLAPNYLEPQFFCRHCEDRGEVNGVRCSCFDRELKSEAFRQTGLGGFLSDQSFDNFDFSYYPMNPLAGGTVRSYMERVFTTCKTYAETFSDQSPSLLFSGATGLGKTHLSSAIGRMVSDNGHAVIYDTAGTIFTKLDDRRFGRCLEEETENYFSCDLLIIDDLGSELTTSLTVAHLFSLINSRLNAGKQLLISTNLNPEELRTRYEEKVASRLIGSFKTLFFFGKDIREIKAGIQ